MKGLHQLSYVLVWVGAINWGLVGLVNYNVVDALLGGWPALVKLIYVLVGAAGVYLLFTHKNYCKYCGTK